MNFVGKNILWGGLDQSLRLVFFLVLMMYYSYSNDPYKVGLLSKVLFVLQILNSFARLSLDSFMIKSIIGYNNYSIVGKYLKIRILNQVLSSLFFVFFIWVFDLIDLSFTLISLIIFFNFFRVHEVIESYFKSYNSFKIIFIARLLSYTMISLIIIFLVNKEYMEIIFVLDAFLMLVLMIFFYFRNNQEKDKIVLSLKRYKPVLLDETTKGFSLTMSFLLYLFLSKMDWFSIWILKSDDELGVYSFFTRFIEPLVAITTVLAISYYPSLVKKYEDSSDKFHNFFFRSIDSVTKIGWGIYVLGVLVFTFVATPLIEVYYPKFSEGITIYYILSFNVVLYFNSCLRSYYLILAKKSNLILRFTIICVIICFPIALALTHYFGYKGAAISAVLYNLIYQILINFFFVDTKRYANIQVRALFTPKLTKISGDD